MYGKRTASVATCPLALRQKVLIRKTLPNDQTLLTSHKLQLEHLVQEQAKLTQE